MTELIILPPLKAQRGRQGGYVLTRKYIEGVAEFAKTWPGPVTSLVGISSTATTDMDHEEFAPDDPVTPIETRPATSDALGARLAGAALVLTFLSPSEEPTVPLCKQLGIPLVFWAEYTPQTEAQIMRAETVNPLRRWRKQRWLDWATRVRRAMVQDAAGLQCSGMPVHDSYAELSPNPIVFWDNRVRQTEIITEQDMCHRTHILSTGAPLRLAFGGRLIKMKGVLYLPEFAAILDKMQVPFTLDIYGSGPLDTELKRTVAALGLTDRITLKGALDFRSEWLPTLREKVDLFICPHPQGDPSSTYPETMSCGLPTAGFANEALSSITRVSGSGWTVPIGDTAALAQQVKALHEQRDEIAAHATRARLFAQDHCFEKTKEHRARHLIEISQAPHGH